MKADLGKPMAAAENNTQRQKVFQTVENFWPDLDGAPYALLDVFKMTKQQLEEVREITGKIAGIYDKMAALLRKLPDETLLEIGLPGDSLPFIREKALPFEGIIRRIDMVKTSRGWKHYEINADTPTFIMEVFRVNGVVTEYMGCEDANSGCEEQLRAAIQNAVFHSCHGASFPKLVFTASKKSREDSGTARYLADLSGLPCEYVPLEDLKIIKGIGLFTPNGERIDVLYRQTYPVEFMVEDVSGTGTKVGVELMKLVREGKLSVINPLSSFLLQSKAVQALIWNLHEERHIFFTEEEHLVIENHFLPTYLAKEVFLEKRLKFVSKPVFGREGDTVVIYDEEGNPIKENPNKNYHSYLQVYQEYVELPKGEIMTPDGKITLHLLLGSFIINDQASAVGIRAGGKITGNTSFFLPVGIQK